MDNVLLAYGEYEHIEGGYVGVALGLSDFGSQTIFEFDNFELRIPGE